MGNTPSCVPLPPVPGTSSSSATAGGSCKVIHADGTVTRLDRPVRASELMLDHPGMFVCDACRLTVGCRVPGVAADELLEPRRAYFLLPMDMLYSVLTDEEMAALSAGCSHSSATAWSSWRRIATTARRSAQRSGTSGRPRDSTSSSVDGASSRVFPVLGLHLHADHGGGAQAGHAAAAAGVKSSGAFAGLRRHRSWRPALDTIEEAP